MNAPLKITTITRNPLISVLVPTYNNAVDIESFLSSLKRQTYPNLEIIISDNFSRDGTFEKLVEYASKNPKVKVFQQEFNRGALQNFSDLIGRANGEFLCIIPVGDIISDSYIEGLVRIMELSPYNVICIPTIHVMLNDKKIYSIEYEAKDFKSSHFLRILQKYLYLTRNTPGLALYSLMRSDSAKKCLPIPQIRGGDICFLHILSLLGNVVSTSEVIFKYSARARWNTYEEDSRFFFGENARSHGSRSRFRKKSSKEMAKFESVWIRGQYGLSKGHWIFYIIFLYNHAFFTVKRLLAQIVTFCAPRDFARSFVIWLYINLRSANYIKEVDLNLFYEREIIPVFRLRERL